MSNKKYYLFLVIFFFFTTLASAKSLENINPYEENGLFGYKDSNGKVIIKAKYRYTHSFNKNGFAIVLSNNGWIYIDKSGKEILNIFLFDNGPDYFVEGLARFVSKNKMGFFNENGEIVVPAIYDFVFPFHNGKAIVVNGCKMVKDGEHSLVKGGKWSIIDKKGKVVEDVKEENQNINNNTVNDKLIPNTNPENNLLIEKMKLWDSKKILNYEFNIFIEQGLSADPRVGRPKKITVKDKKIYSVEFASFEDQKAFGKVLDREYPDMLGVFNIIKKAIDKKADLIKVTYDDKYGFPVHVYIDYDKSSADEELTVEVSNFKELSADRK